MRDRGSTPRTPAAPDRPIAALMSALGDFYRKGRRSERACYVVAAILMLSGLLHLGILIVSGGSWSGPVSWRKPGTFGLSFGLTLATITWVTSFVQLSRRGRTALLSVFATACVIEVAVITVQAWRGRPSHFSSGGAAGSAADGVSGGVAAVGAISIVVTVMILTLTSLRANAAEPPSMRLAVRTGLLSLMVALAIGVVMLARGLYLARGFGDVNGAFAFSAGLKPGHAATMHGVLVLPALAWLLSRSSLPERSRLAVVRTGCLGYALFAVVVVVETVAGADPTAITSAPVVATALTAGGAAALMVAGGIALTGAIRRPRRTGHTAPPDTGGAITEPSEYA